MNPLRLILIIALLLFASAFPASANAAAARRRPSRSASFASAASKRSASCSEMRTRRGLPSEPGARAGAGEARVSFAFESKSKRSDRRPFGSGD